MMSIVYKFGYVLARQSAFFSLPGLRRLRNFLYSRHLVAEDIAVDDFVRIGPAHCTNASRVQIGASLRVGRNVEIDTSGGITIGVRVTISEDAKIYSHDHIIDDGFIDWRLNGLKISPIFVGDDAWIGAGAIVLSTVNYIGRGAIVAAGSVVKNDIPDFTIVAGNPAKIIRTRRFSDDIVPN